MNRPHKPAAMPKPALGDLTDAEIGELDDLLAAVPQPWEAVDAVMLDGYLCGVLVQPVTLEPAQVAGQKCKASGKLIAFEKDARLCGRCGEIYHKDSVPKRCEVCDARLLK